MDRYDTVVLNDDYHGYLQHKIDMTVNQIVSHIK